MGEWVIVSDFVNIDRIYRACELFFKLGALPHTVDVLILSHRDSQPVTGWPQGVPSLPTCPTCTTGSSSSSSESLRSCWIKYLHFVSLAVLKRAFAYCDIVRNSWLIFKSIIFTDCWDELPQKLKNYMMFLPFAERLNTKYSFQVQSGQILQSVFCTPSKIRFL